MGRLHLQGMGIVGCYLALRLLDDGVDFTWSDNEERINAWRASTGAIFPTGHADDLWAMDVWTRHLTQPVFGDFLEEAEYVFSTQHPPHEGNYRYEDLGPVRVAHHHSLHLNAQTWVPATRKLLDNLRVDGPERGEQLVIAHGFGQRLVRYMWGWTVPVRIQTVRSLGTPGSTHPLREALYFRKGRFTMAYAYPIPGTDMWYAGSSLISQRRPNALAVEPKYLKWRDTMYDLGGGYIVGMARAGLPVHGWRPVPAKDDDAWVSWHDGAVHVRPLWHSGIRHAPLVYNALREAL